MQISFLREEGHGEYSVSNANTSSDQFLSAFSEDFNVGIHTTKKELELAMKELHKNPSDPTALAAYQSRLAEYTLYRNAQSNSVKVYKDVGANTIRNFV